MGVNIEDRLGRKLELLVVDDEQSVVDMYRQSLSKIGVNIATATNGIEAIRIYELRKNNLPLDGVITDLSMPDMNGVDLTRKIKSIDPKTQVVVISGYVDSDEYGKMSLDIDSLEPDGRLSKPVYSDSLNHVAQQMALVQFWREHGFPNYKLKPSDYVIPQSPQS